MASIISAGTTSGTSLNLSGDTSGVLQLASNGSTTAVTITTAQNVGIGTSSPAAKLDIRGSSPELYVAQDGSNNGVALAWDNSNAFAKINTIGAAWPILFLQNGTERMRIDSSGNLLFNSGYGSVATAYGCRAWVNFNGTGTPAIRGSGNVSSITDNGTGLYTINFTTALPDVNYSVNLGLDSSPSTCGFSLLGGSDRASSNTTSSFRINTYAGSFNLTDYAIITAAVFR